MRIRLLPVWLCGLLATGCARPVPTFDPTRLPPGMLEKCEALGAVVLEDERYEDYAWAGYDNFKARVLSQAGALGAMKIPAAFRRTVFKIVGQEGAAALSRLEVSHHREQPPEVTAVAWTADGVQRPMNVEVVGVQRVADWRCTNASPRLTAYRLGPLNPGDTLEVRYPLSGPDQETWDFADPRFCVLRSRAAFGHPDDTSSMRLGMDALLADSTGAVERVSAEGAWPVVFESTKPLPPLSRERLPRVVRTGRCRGFEYLTLRVFHLPLWLARDGRPEAPAELMAAVEPGGRSARLQAVRAWLRGLQVRPEPQPAWMRWLPGEPVEDVARLRRGSQGGLACLVFRVLEEAGLAPRFALLYLDAETPFNPAFVSPIQFDSLAVVAVDDQGVDHWLVPGLEAPGDEPVPAFIRYRWALRMERWVAERFQGGGACDPALDMLFACQNETKALEPMKLVRPGRP
jgi:hypothetical protein